MVSRLSPFKGLFNVQFKRSGAHVIINSVFFIRKGVPHKRKKVELMDFLIQVLIWSKSTETKILLNNRHKGSTLFNSHHLENVGFEHVEDWMWQFIPQTDKKLNTGEGRKKYLAMRDKLKQELT